MSHYSQYNIANVIISISSNADLHIPDALTLFEDSRSTKIDFSYRCSMQQTLPNLPLLGNVKYYYDSVGARDFAVTEENNGSMTIHLSRQNLPWGSDIRQLYTQFALPHVLLVHHKLLLHASYISTPDGAIVFTAPSGTGKSTQAELWRAHRHAQIINGDRAVVGIENSIATAYGYPISGTSEHCRNATEKLRAIVVLRQASVNSVRRLTGTEALLALVNGSYLPEEYASDLSLVIDCAVSLCERVPVLELSCRPDMQAVETLALALS